MPADAISLLRQLGSGANPLSGSGGGTGVTATSDNPFADLLKKAQAGELSSSRSVTLSSEARDAGVRLNDEQLAMISAAADQAETAGVRTALVLIGGQALTLDVGSRTITAAARGTSGVMAGFDGMINLSDSGLNANKSETSPAIGFPKWALTTPGLAAALQPKNEQGQAA